MRVHRLEVAAFGPFADRQVVDFDRLNAAGVFVLTGPTGAGKTSVLDAICFALFGRVPGARDTAKAYRSDHAAPGVAPRVVLDVTLRGRRLRLTRAPSWRRPSRRARVGWVEQPARATVEELVHGQWRPVSARIDEVGHLVSHLLRLNRDQFCQVVMLPQGDFQAFLRSGAKDRQRILESIFGTERFQAVERWLVEHRREQSRRCRAREDALDLLLARLSEAADPALEGLPISDDESRDAELVTRVRAAVARGAAELAAVSADAAAATERGKEAIHALDEGRTLAARQARMLEARRQHAALLALDDVAAAREDRVRLARQAAVLAPSLAACAEADEALARASRELELALAAVADAPGADDVGRVIDDLARRTGVLEALAEDERRAVALTERLGQGRSRRTHIADRLEELRTAHAAEPGRVAELRAAIAAAGEVVRRREDSAHDLQEARRLEAAVGEVVRLDADVAGLATALLRQRELTADVTERWLAARERHLAGIAAELSALLVPGDPCLVCGSVEHPAPARPGPAHVSATDEQRLLDGVTAARAEVERLERLLTQTEAARLSATQRAGGLDPVQAATGVAAAERRVAEVSAAAAEQQRLEAVLAAVLDEVAGRERSTTAAQAELARLEAQLEEWHDQATALRSRLDAELGVGQTAAVALDAATARLAHLEQLERAGRDHEEAGRAVRSACRRLHRAMGGSPFATPQAAAAAVMTEAEIADQEALQRAYHADLAATRRTLEDPALVAADGCPPPDLGSLEAAAGSAAAEAEERRLLAAAIERRQDRLAAITEQLAEVMDGLGPLRRSRDLADSVAGALTGAPAVNPSRTALSHFVLAARLAQVVAAANHRLESIGAGRYRLEHSMQRGAGDSRGGLGLVVRDSHTDAPRDPATLSGGETFYVSLALALGLADVVTAEAGGAELSTLFVDEGFGMLDDDTRDEVLDELDALRSGGRSVGLVSHLAELKARFPAQLQVVATTTGSRCLPVGGHAGDGLIPNSRTQDAD